MGEAGVTAGIIEDMKNTYKNKLLPLEEMYDYAHFHTSHLTDVEFAAKPHVLLLGQYSVGKTSVTSIISQSILC